jgi:ATP-dependent protease HslVU (ClpYQ) peptidase subunit
MSLVVALKHNGVVYMGSDSLACYYDTKYYLTNPNSYRIFKVKGCDNMLMSLDGRIVEQNVARCTYLVPEAVSIKGNIDFEFMVNEFVPNLLEAFNERHILKCNDNQYECDSDMIVAYKDSLYKIFNDGAVLEIDDFAVIGTGIEEALGSLMTSSNIEDPKERLLLALKAGLRDKKRIAYPLIITNTCDCEFEIITEEE